MQAFAPATFGAIAALSAGGFYAPQLLAEPAKADQSVVANIRTADGTDAGAVTFDQTGHGLIVTAKLMNLGPGPHGFHIHETGACSPDFKAAGGHFNPDGSEHGFHNEGGYHVGDLPNVEIGADGTGTASFFIPDVTLDPAASDAFAHTLADADGSAIMIHARGDDYLVMASSGDRVACGVIVPKR